tara:strand:- start:137 stop:859 length:723 start_codon:yes stop_codon:yes gene_type:complete
MKSLLKNILIFISKAIYQLIPYQFKSNNLENKLKSNLIEETFSNFKEDFKKSVLFQDLWKMREHAIKTSLLNDKDKNYYYCEFGVWKGESANFFSKFVNDFYAFDSFEGLKEDWAGTSGITSDFNLNKRIPKLNSNIKPIVGWAEDTLDDFLKKHNPKINFVHIDMDTYSPTKFVLQKIKPYLVKDAIILFDELFYYIGWEHGEYKALKEVFKDNEFVYKSFRIEGEKKIGYAQCAIQIL